MMSALPLLAAGFGAVLNPISLLLVVAGIVVGMLFALLPGLNLVIAVVLLLPFTYPMGTLNAVFLLMGAYVGGTYAGVITAILFNIPGDSIHVPMLWDGHTMTRRGQAALAIGWTVVAFVVGGLLAALIMTFVSGPWARVALRFSTPEFFSVIVFGLASVSALGAAMGSSIPATILSLSIGLLFGTVGVDSIYGSDRFTFGVSYLSGGIHFIPVMIGLYAVGEILGRVREQGWEVKQQTAYSGFALPPLRELLRRWRTFLRGTSVGAVIGALPGAGATVASFVSYGLEKQYGAARNELGTGAPEGLAVTQSAATASVGGALIPLLTLGIPGSVADAIILGALQLHEVYPSPLVFRTQPHLIYSIFASVYVALALTVVVTLVSMRAMVAVLRVRPAVLMTFILLLSVVGAYVERSSIGDVWVAVGCGVLGYILNRLRFPTAPLLLGVILGPLAETNFVTTMVSYHNDWTVFFTHPISALFLALSAVSFLLPILKVGRSAAPREAVETEPPGGDS